MIPVIELGKVWIRATRTYVWLGLLAARFAIIILGIPSVHAQAPPANVPLQLRGQWQGGFDGLGQVTLELRKNSAIIYSSDKSPVGFLSGTFTASGQMQLQVLLALPAFHGLPEGVWADAVSQSDHNDNLIRTTLALRYANDTGELVGDYSPLKIHFTKAGKYRRTEVVDNEPIRLHRRRSGEASLIDDSEPP